MKNFLLCIFLSICSVFGFGQILEEGFDDITNLPGWTMTNQSTTVGSTNWFQGNTGVFNSHSGDPTSYIGANFNNTTGGTGTISNWLITPTLNLKDGDTLTFWTRTSEGSIWDDRLEVRSSVGAMTVPSGGPTDVGSFTTVNLIINDDYSLSYPEVWTEFEVVVSGVGSTPVAMNFAFRYNVILAGPSGTYSNYIGIDTVSVVEGDGGGGGDTDCETTPGIIINDDGTVENGGSGNPATVTEVIFVDKFTPSSYPATIESVCAAFVTLTGGTPNMSYDIVVYDDDGAAGVPGTLLGEMNGLTANDIPVFTAGAAPVWQTASTASENWEVTEGSVYIGVRFIPSTPNHFMAMDQTTSTPQGQGYWWNDSDGIWQTITSGWPTYRSLFVRPVLASDGGPGGDECEWTVHVWEDYFGDEVSWELRASDGTILLSGGGYGNGYDDTQTVTAAGPLEFYIEALGLFGDNEPSYEVSNGTEVLVSGQILSTGSGEATYSDLNCADVGEPEEGCFVTGTFDQWPSTTYVPACMGVEEPITTAGWAGEFSKVQVTAGVEYIFSSSVATDYITIADEDEEIAFATGTGTVTWTSPVDQVIRFYTHTDEDCGIESVSRTRAVQCGEPFIVEEPDYPCFQGDGLASNGFENGYNVIDGSDYRNADDFIVDGSFTVQYIRMNFFMNPGATVSSATFNIRGDEGGAPSEDDIVETFTLTPISHQVLGSNFGYDISQVEFVLTDEVELGAGTYWLQPLVTASDAGAVFWEISSTGTLGNPIHTSEFNGSWNADPDGMQAVFFIAGECGETSTECSQEFTSDDVTNGVGFINDGANHLIAANDVVVAADTSFNVERITLDVVSLGGEPTVFDVSFYEDDAGVSTQIGATQTGVTPTSITPNGTFGSAGYPVYTVVIDLPTQQLLQAPGADTRFWIGISGAPSVDAQFVYWISYDYTATTDSEPTWQSQDGGATWSMFVSSSGANAEGVMLVEGTCDTLGVSDMTSFDFAYYPNPVKDVLNITSQKAVQNVSVYNLAGQQMLASAKVVNGQINVSGLSSGVYVFRVTLEGGKVETFKIIKK